MLTIDSLPLPSPGGVLGLSRCPGGGPGEILPGMSRAGRALAGDLEAIAGWGAVGVISLNESSELRWLGLSSLGEAVRDAGLQWWHCPIPDFCAPGRAFETAWAKTEPELLACLAEDRKVLIHCLAGLGRTGTVCARVLIDHAGLTAEEAIRCVRMARPGAIQSEEQMHYLLDREWRAPEAGQ